MKKVIVCLLAFSILGFLPAAYAGKKETPKPYHGAGIGKEVSTQAKELKGTENKTGFGETVRTQAQEKTRIQEHKELKKESKIHKRQQKGKTKQKKEQINSTVY